VDRLGTRKNRPLKRAPIVNRRQKFLRRAHLKRPLFPLDHVSSCTACIDTWLTAATNLHVITWSKPARMGRRMLKSDRSCRLRSLSFLECGEWAALLSLAFSAGQTGCATTQATSQIWCPPIQNHQCPSLPWADFTESSDCSGQAAADLVHNPRERAPLRSLIPECGGPPTQPYRQKPNAAFSFPAVAIGTDESTCSKLPA
jgi:hypothetical protein